VTANNGRERLPSDQGTRKKIVREIETSFMVEAGAGTGKTTLLIDRLLHLIESGVIISRIAAITFTEKAAAELKVRLRRRLEVRLAELAGSESHTSEAEAVRGALHGLESASINTIHGFCATLLRERPVEAGIDPGFVMADETGQSMLLEAAFREFLEQCAQRQDDVLRDAFALGTSLESLRKFAWKLAEERDLLQDPRVFQEPARPDPHSFIARFGDFVDRMMAARSSCKDPRDKLYELIGKLAAERDLLESAPHDPAGRSKRESLLMDLPTLKSVGKQGNWNPESLCKDAKKEIGLLKNSLAQYREAVRSFHGARLFALCARGFPSVHAELKQSRGVLDFQDLLVKTRDLLRDRPDVRRDFKRAFHAIHLDEFQDTDPLQAEIAFFLSEEPGQDATDWESVRVGAGRLFLVGDAKQSIYRFRRADTELYQRAKARVVACGGKVASIVVNFRSAPGLLEWVNSRFSQLIRKPDDGDYQPDYERLDVSPTAVEDGPALVVLADTANPAPGNTDDAREVESHAIARYLTKIHGEGTAFDECAILFRATTGLEILESALRAHDIPYRVSRGKHLYSRAEVKAAVALLRAVDDPTDGVAVVATLRSPLFGVSDADLARHRLADGGFDFRSKDVASSSSSSSSSPAPVREALALLRSLHDMRHDMTLPEFVEEVWARTRALEIFQLKPAGHQRVANLLKFVDMARTMEAAGAQTIRSFVAYVSDMEQGNAKEAESVLVDDGTEAVQIMTVHLAKGLEFPMVILADLAGGSNVKDGFIVGRGAVPCIDFKLEGSGLRSPGWEAASEREEPRQEAEDVRLFYVAATRAKQRLVLPRVFKPTKEGMPNSGRLKYLADDEVFVNPAEHPGARFEDAALLPMPDVEVRAFRLKLRTGDVAWDLDARQVLTERDEFQSGLRQSFAGRRLQHRRAVTSATAAKRDGVDFRFGARGEAAPRGRRFGVLAHRVFELLDFSGDNEHLPGRSRALARDEGLTEHDAAEAVRLATEFLETPLCERLKQAVRVVREAPFVFVLKESQDEEQGGSLVEGAIDLLAEEADGRMLIVDWKTDSVESDDPDNIDERFEHYRPQGDVYAQAVRAATGRDVADVVFAFVRVGATRSC